MAHEFTFEERVGMIVDDGGGVKYHVKQLILLELPRAGHDVSIKMLLTKHQDSPSAMRGFVS